MSFWLILALVHLLFWGAVGAAVAPRARIATWLGAVIAIAAPVVGVLVLAVIGSRNKAPGVSEGQLATSTGGVLWGVIGGVGGVLIASSGWFDWATASAAGALGDASDSVSWSASGGLASGSATTVAGVAIVGLVALAARGVRRYPVPIVATIAWLPVALGTSCLFAANSLDPLLGRLSSWSQAATDMSDQAVRVAGDLMTGAGPLLATAGGFAALVWGAGWALFAPTPVRPVAVDAPSQQSPHWPTAHAPANDGWGGAEGSSENPGGW